MVVQSKGLTEKHLRAINLIMDGHAVPDVASQTGFSTQVMYALMEGNANKAGNVAILFRAELESREEIQTLDIKKLIQSNQRESLEILQTWLKAARESIDNDATKELVKPATIKTIIKGLQALLSSGATTKIGEMHIHAGLNQEDLLNEFKRLKKLAKDAVAFRRGVRSAETGGSDVLPEAPGKGD